MFALVFTALFLFLGASPLFTIQAACPPPAAGELHRVDQVYDGDTLRLSGETRVRLAGINTPELRHDKGADEPYAVQARERLLRLIADAGHHVHIQPAAETQDGYGRLLAHAYTPAGVSLQEQILLAGLGLTHIHPPNLANLECYQQAETQARELRRGIWNSLPIAAAALNRNDRGFVVLHGRVARVRNTRRSIWLELHAGPSLRIARRDLSHFDTLEPSTLAGRSLEARGWLHHHRNRLQVRIRHPAALRIDN